MSELILLPTLRYGGAASDGRRLALSASAQHPQGRDTHVAVLGEGGPWADDLRQRGVTVHCFNWTRLVDPAALLRLRALVDDLRPETIHAFGLSPLRCLGAIAPTSLQRTWAYRVGTEDALSRLDRWLLDRVRGCVARTEWEADALRRGGVVNVNVSRPEPAIAPPPFSDPGVSEAVIAIGRLEQRHGVRDALWTMDILAYAFPETRLALVGEGSLDASLRDLQTRVHHARRTRFLPSVPDVGPLLAAAKVCWITARQGHGLNVALEAQACGCPIVAYDQPPLREIVRAGETALLVPPRDMIGLARKTYTLFKDEPRRREMAAAARKQTHSAATRAA